MSNLNSVLGVMGISLMVFSLAIIVLCLKHYQRCMDLIAGFALTEVAFMFVLLLFRTSIVRGNFGYQPLVLVDISYSVGWLFLFPGPVVVLLAPRLLRSKITDESDETMTRDQNYEKYAYFIPLVVLALIAALAFV